MIDQGLQKFESSVDNLLLSLNLSNDKDAIKKNISASLYFNYINAIFGSSEAASLTQKLKNQEALSIESFYKLIEEGKTLSSNDKVDFSSVFKNSCNAVLNGFITELEPKLAPEKVTELRKIVSEGV